jgi:hypothetical protein
MKASPSPWKTHESCGSDDLTKAHFMTTQRVPIELRVGHELPGAPFLSEEMMYQAMIASIIQPSPLGPS